MKYICGSNCKHPEHKSKKACVCGGHSNGAKKPRSKDKHVELQYWPDDSHKLRQWEKPDEDCD